MNKKQRYRQLLTIFSMLIPLAFLGACVFTDPQSTFDTHGPVARSQLIVFYYTLGVATFLFLTVGGAFLYAVFRFREKPGEERTVPQQSHGNSMVEVVLIMASFALLAVIAVPNVKVLFEVDRPPVDERETSLKVDVIGHQWWWEFRYPEYDLVTANELHIPVNRAVEFTLHSEDVIHSFWVPKLAGKVDVMPGLQKNYMWFKAEKTGTYYGQCVEFCGESHANMRFMVFSDSEDDFEQWVKAQKEPAAQPPDTLALNGQAAFREKGCIACHTIQGVSAGTNGPNLTHFGSRTTLGAGILENTNENRMKWLTAPEEVKPGSLMNFKDLKISLSPREMEAMNAYLQSLK